MKLGHSDNLDLGSTQTGRANVKSTTSLSYKYYNAAHVVCMFLFKLRCVPKPALRVLRHQIDAAAPSLNRPLVYETRSLKQSRPSFYQIKSLDWCRLSFLWNNVKRKMETEVILKKRSFNSWRLKFYETRSFKW